jgi:hypothetical protein
MKRTFFISLFNTFILFSILITFLLVTGCGKSKNEIKKDATDIVNNYKESVEKYEGWVQDKADFNNPVIQNQNVGFKAKLDTAMSKWNQNKDMFKQKLQLEEYNKLENDIKSAESKIPAIEELFKKKLAQVQGDTKGDPEQDATDEENNQ